MHMHESRYPPLFGNGMPSMGYTNHLYRESARRELEGASLAGNQYSLARAWLHSHQSYYVALLSMFRVPPVLRRVLSRVLPAVENERIFVLAPCARSISRTGDSFAIKSI